MIIKVYVRDGKVMVTRSKGKGHRELCMFSDLKDGDTAEIEIEASLGVVAKKETDKDE